MDSEAWAHWLEIQEGIAAVTGLSFITYNAAGRVSLSAPACAPSHDHPVCAMLQQQYGHAASCHASRASSALVKRSASRMRTH